MCSHETEKPESGNDFAGSQAGGCSAPLRLFLCEQSTLWQAPHLSCQLSPFFHRNQRTWGMAEWSSTNSHLFNSGCVEKWDKRREGNWEELAAWNMEWFETEIASWILNWGRCTTEPSKLSPWKCCESSLALQADELVYIRINRLKAGYFLLNDFFFFDC